jgi:DNA-binding CsgD family transcriptional regulator
VPARLSVDASAVRHLADLSDPQHRDQPGTYLPQSVLEAVRSLVPCDDVTYQVQDVARRTVLGLQELEEGPSLSADEEAAVEELYWRGFWSSQCSYPNRTGDYVSVTRASDFESRRQLSTSRTGDVLRANGMRHEVLLPLAPRGPHDERLLLWREDGPDFSDRDVLLLAMVRAHIVALRDAVLAQSRNPVNLTERQLQLLRLVATGLTNRQIARQLDLSEHTVRKHLENIFERLQVTSRTAAVARAMPEGRTG